MNCLTTIETALASRHVIISITGPAAGETEPGMRKRKLAELASEAHRIFWGIASYTCPVFDVCDLVAANGNQPAHVLLFDGGSATSISDAANFYAANALASAV